MANSDRTRCAPQDRSDAVPGPLDPPPGPDPSGGEPRNPWSSAAEVARETPPTRADPTALAAAAPAAGPDDPPGAPGTSAEILGALAQEYRWLRCRARTLLEGDRLRHRLDPEDLVNAACLKLARSGRRPSWRDAAHLVRIATRAMRQVLATESRHWTATPADLLDDQPTPDAPCDQARVDSMAELEVLLDLVREHRPESLPLLRVWLETGVTPTGAGRAVGLPPWTARRTWGRAMALLRRQLAQRSARGKESTRT